MTPRRRCDREGASRTMSLQEVSGRGVSFNETSRSRAASSAMTHALKTKSHCQALRRPKSLADREACMKPVKIKAPG